MNGKNIAWQQQQSMDVFPESHEEEENTMGKYGDTHAAQKEGMADAESAEI